MGSSDDYEKFEKYAKIYLSHALEYHEYPWFVFPNTPSETLINSETLKSFRCDCAKKMNLFIRKNDILVQEISKNLISEKMLGADICFSYLDRVIM